VTLNGAVSYGGVPSFAMASHTTEVKSRRLDSWKEIAAYLSRDVRTVIRWEKERGLPIHRVPGGKKNTVFAFTEKLDSWLLTDVTPPNSRLLAVLPFSNASNDPALDYLCDGLTESLINRLSQSQELRVLARSTVFRYRGADVDALAAGRALGVPIVVAGVVRQDRDDVVVGTELVNTRSGLQLWGSRYSQSIGDIWDLEIRVVDAIASELRLQLTSSERDRLTRAYTRNPEAMRFYWRGRQAFQKFSEEGFQQAIQCFEQAIALDPNYGKAHAAMAETYGFLALGYSAERPEAELVRLGEKAARTALACDPTLGEAHCALGILLAHTCDLRKIEAEIQRAIELQPSNALARDLNAYALLSRGLFDEAICEIDIALELDPASVVILVDAAAINAYAGDLESARELMERAQQSFTYPGSADPSWMYVLGLIHQLQGDHEKAIDVLERSTASGIMHTIPLGILGYSYAKAGKRDKAEEVLDRLANLSPQRHAVHFSRAAIFAGLEKREQTLESLERGYEEKNPLLFLMNVAPWFEGMRSHPRFRAIVEQLDL
jgi:eukaryotic-like serine/threonine-protein kinase